MKISSLAEIEAYIGFEIPQTKCTISRSLLSACEGSISLKKWRNLPELKRDKSELVNKDIMKLYFNGGKKKKLRAFDFVGTITSIPGVTGEDIGIIKIQDTETYIDILNGKGSSF